MIIDEADIKDALSSVARLIDRYGDTYWPILERLERELADRQSRQRRLSAYLQRASASSKTPASKIHLIRDERSS